MQTQWLPQPYRAIRPSHSIDLSSISRVRGRSTSTNGSLEVAAAEADQAASPNGSIASNAVLTNESLQQSSTQPRSPLGLYSPLTGDFSGEFRTSGSTFTRVNRASALGNNIDESNELSHSLGNGSINSAECAAGRITSNSSNNSSTRSSSSKTADQNNQQENDIYNSHNHGDQGTGYPRFSVGVSASASASASASDLSTGDKCIPDMDRTVQYLRSLARELPVTSHFLPMQVSYYY